MYYVYAQWLLNEGNSSQRGFHGTHRPPSGSATELYVYIIKIPPTMWEDRFLHPFTLTVRQMGWIEGLSVC